MFLEFGDSGRAWLFWELAAWFLKRRRLAAQGEGRFERTKRVLCPFYPSDAGRTAEAHCSWYHWNANRWAVRGKRAGTLQILRVRNRSAFWAYMRIVD
jgi:hypothetical protein